MSNTNVNTPVDKILLAIQRKGSATVSELKRSIFEFNQAGGVEKLRKHLADLVSNGALVIQANKSGNGQTIESYCLTNCNASNGRNIVSNTRSNRNVGNADNGSNLKITITFDIVLEDWQDVIFTLFNTDKDNSDNNNSNESNAELPETDAIIDEGDEDDNAGDFLPREQKPGQSTPSRSVQNTPSIASSERRGCILDDDDTAEEEDDFDPFGGVQPPPTPTVPVRQGSRFPNRSNTSSRSRRVSSDYIPNDDPPF